MTRHAGVMLTALGLLAATLGLAPAAHCADPSWPKEINFGMLSTESSIEIAKRWTPVLEQLERDLGVRVKPFFSTDYRGTIEALRFKKVDVAQLGPKAYVEASTNDYAHCEPIVQLRHVNGSLGYRSALIVHRDSDLFSPEDLRGRTFAFNDPNSTSGYLVPMTFFVQDMRIDPQQYFSRVTFSGSHEASILAVANKKVDAASTNLPDIKQMALEGKIPRDALRVVWVSPLIPNDPIVVRKDLPASLKQALQEALATMSERSPRALGGGEWLGGFVKVDDSRYAIVRQLNETARQLAAARGASGGR